jgi:hypothetical protein
LSTVDKEEEATASTFTSTNDHDVEDESVCYNTLQPPIYQSVDIGIQDNADQLTYKHKQIQVNIKRNSISKAIQVKPLKQHVATQCDAVPKKVCDVGIQCAAF